MTRHRADATGRHELRGDRGTTALEYILVLGLVAALVVALTSAGIVGRARPAIAWAVCQLFSFGGTCAASTTTGAPTDPCVRSSTGATLEFGVNVVFVDLGAGEGFVLEEQSDGRHKVTWAETTEAGATAALVQGEGTVRVGPHRFGLEGDISASGARLWEVGDSRTFASEDDAVDYILDRAVDEGIEALPDGLREGAQAGRAVVDWATGNDRDEGEDNERNVQDGIRIGAQASATAGPLSGELAVAAEGALQVTQKENGERSIALSLSREGSASLGVPVLAEAGASASGQYTVEFTVSPEGALTSLKVSVETAGSVEVSGLDRRQTPEQVLREVGASLGGTEEDRSVIDYTLQLDSPELRDAALTFLQDAPRTGADLLRGDTSRLEQASRDLWSDGLGPATTISAREYRDEELGAGLAAKLRVLSVGAGGTADLSVRTSRLQDAVYWDTTNGGFVPDTACLG